MDEMRVCGEGATRGGQIGNAFFRGADLSMAKPDGVSTVWRHGSGDDLFTLSYRPSQGHGERVNSVRLDRWTHL